MKKWYLVDVCGDFYEEVTPLPEFCKTVEQAIAYGKDYWNQLVDWQKKLRSEFYVSFMELNEEGDFPEQDNAYDCDNGEISFE